MVLPRAADPVREGVVAPACEGAAERAAPGAMPALLKRGRGGASGAATSAAAESPVATAVSTAADEAAAVDGFAPIAKRKRGAPSTPVSVAALSAEVSMRLMQPDPSPASAVAAPAPVRTAAAAVAGSRSPLAAPQMCRTKNGSGSVPLAAVAAAPVPSQPSVSHFFPQQVDRSKFVASVKYHGVFASG